MSRHGPAIVLLCLAACADPPAATPAPSAAADAAAAGPDVPALPPDAQPADAAPAVACATAATYPKPASPCQAASCHPQLGCLVASLPDGTVCDDGDACTLASACVSGTCIAAVALGCSDDNPCTIDTCNPTKGCVHGPAADGVACDDGKPCSGGDDCLAGACVGGPSICQCDKAADCLAFEDGDACNGTLYCDKAAGKCTLNPATVVACVAAGTGACAASACDPKTGKCLLLPKNDGAACDDSDPCTTAGTCLQGECSVGANTCNCSQDVDCAAKEDGNACNGTLYCNKAKGTCTVNPATVVTCPSADDTPCTKSTCAPATGKCAAKSVADKTPCDDGIACTVAETCSGGKCLGSADTCPCQLDVDCIAQDDGNLCNGKMFCNKQTGKCEINPATVVTCQTGLDTVCVKHLCDVTSGKCAAVSATESTPCDADGNGCTVGDHCAGGKCQPGTDVCACKSDAECAKQDDGNLCNGTFYCDKTSGNCLLNPKTVVKCATVGDTVCQKNLCDPSLGKCELTAVNEFQPCDADGLLCTLNDQCKAGACKPGANICECLGDGDCSQKDDGNLCNGTPYCDKSKALFTCITNPKTVVVCAQTGQAPCSVTSCEAKSGLCKLALGQDGLDCDDGSQCTLGDACKGGVCGAVAALSCDDGTPCTLDACKAKSGCLHLPVAATCSDGDACTANEACLDSKCQGAEAVTCADGNPCTDDSCNPKKGCVFLANAATCSDGDACTLGDGCKGGGCVTSGKNPCSDAEPCTQDACDAKTGLCSHAASAACKRAPCLTKADCGAGLVCDVALHSCVACTHASQCAANEACQGGLCLAGTACQSFVPCKPKGMVCSAATGSCVECLQDGDCGGGKVCQGQRCAAAVPCQTDQDCPAVCNLQGKVCADCNADGDCPGGACGADHMCRPGHTGAKQCAGSSLFTPMAGFQAYAAQTCADDNPCTDAGCALPGGCSQASNTALCDDGEVCSVGDGCKGGKCLAGNGNLCNDGKPCTADKCHPETAVCSHEPFEGPCNDGNACTVSEVCLDGACKNGKVVKCDDGNACTDDACDTKAGCGFAANAATCEAGACTTGDACKGGVCVSSKQAVVWESVVAGTKNGTVRGIAATSNGFFAAVSYGTVSEPSGGALLRLDSYGNVSWKVEPALGSGGSMTGVAESGGDAAVCGSKCASGKCQLWSARYSADGKELVTNTGTSAYQGRYHAITAAPGGGFFLAGRQVVGGAAQDDGFVALTDSGLTGKWSAATGIAGNDAWNTVAVAGGDFVVAGWSASANKGNDGLVARFSGAGAVKWQRSLGGTGEDEFNAVAVMGNGDIALAGSTGSKGAGGRDGWFVRLVGMGERADDRSFGTAGDDEFLAIAEAGGQIAFGGRSQGKGTASQGWLLSLDGWGNTSWQRKWAGDHGPDAFTAVTPHGSGLLVGGARHDFTSKPDAAFLRTDTFGHASCATAAGCIDKSAVDCDDGNGCTLDGCEGGKCVSQAATFALPCNKGAGYCGAGAVCKVAPDSCLALQTAMPGSASGVFTLDVDGVGVTTLPPFKAWCDQTNNGGGWTLVLTADAATQNFTFSSPNWFSSSAFGSDQPGYDTTEAKLASYANLPLKELRIGLRTGGIVRSLSFDAMGPSVLALMKAPVASAHGYAAWAKLVPGMPGSHAGYSAEGVNPPELLHSKVRIGLRISDAENGLGSYHAVIGLGCYESWYNSNGNVAPVGGIQSFQQGFFPAFGYVFVR